MAATRPSITLHGLQTNTELLSEASFSAWAAFCAGATWRAWTRRRSFEVLGTWEEGHSVPLLSRHAAWFASAIVHWSEICPIVARNKGISFLGPAPKVGDKRAVQRNPGAAADVLWNSRARWEFTACGPLFEPSEWGNLVLWCNADLSRRVVSLRGTLVCQCHLRGIVTSCHDNFSKPSPHWAPQKFTWEQSTAVGRDQYQACCVFPGVLLNCDTPSQASILPVLWVSLKQCLVRREQQAEIIDLHHSLWAPSPQHPNRNSRRGTTLWEESWNLCSGREIAALRGAWRGAWSGRRWSASCRCDAPVASRRSSSHGAPSTPLPEASAALWNMSREESKNYVCKLSHALLLLGGVGCYFLSRKKMFFGCVFRKTFQEKTCAACQCQGPFLVGKRTDRKNERELMPFTIYPRCHFGSDVHFGKISADSRNRVYMYCRSLCTGSTPACCGVWKQDLRVVLRNWRKFCVCFKHLLLFLEWTTADIAHECSQFWKNVNIPLGPSRTLFWRISERSDFLCPRHCVEQRAGCDHVRWLELSSMCVNSVFLELYGGGGQNQPVILLLLAESNEMNPLVWPKAAQEWLVPPPALGSMMSWTLKYPGKKIQPQPFHSGNISVSSTTVMCRCLLILLDTLFPCFTGVSRV